MKNNFYLNYIGLSLILVFWACSNPKEAGKTSETTNGISVTIRDSTHTSIPGVKVYLVREQGWLEEYLNNYEAILDSAYSDEYGKVYFEQSHNDYNLYGLSENLGAFKTYINLKNDTSIVVQLKESSELSGNINFVDQDLAEISNTEVYLLGSPYKSQIIEGEFNFKNIAAGDYVLALIDKNNRTTKSLISIEIGSGESKILETVEISEPSFLVEDFESSDLQSALPSSSKWYIKGDEEEGGASSWSSPESSNNESFKASIQEKGYLNSQSFNGFFELDRSVLEPFVDLDLEWNKGFYDFENLDSLSFVVKGNASGEFVFYRDDSDSIPKAMVAFSVTKDWTRITFKSSDFFDDKNKPINWKSFSTEIKKLSFTLSEGDEFSLDDIYFYSTLPLIKY